MLGSLRHMSRVRTSKYNPQLATPPQGHMFAPCLGSCLTLLKALYKATVCTLVC